MNIKIICTLVISQTSVVTTQYALYDDELRFSNIVTSKIVDP